MGAVLKVLANPVISRLAGRVIDKLFNRKGRNDPVGRKVSGTAAAGLIVTAILFVVSVVDPGLVEVLRGADLAIVVAGLVTLVGAIIGYYQPDDA